MGIKIYRYRYSDTDTGIQIQGYRYRDGGIRIQVVVGVEIFSSGTRAAARAAYTPCSNSVTKHPAHQCLKPHVGQGGRGVAPRQRDALLLAMVVRTRPHRIRGIMHIRAGHHAHKGIMHTRAGHHAYKRPTVTTHHDQPNDSQTQHKRCRLLRTQKLQMISLKIPVPHLDLHLQAMNSILHSGTLGHQLLLNFKHSGCRHCAAE